jgi:hypothetical protein
MAIPPAPRKRRRRLISSGILTGLIPEVPWFDLIALRFSALFFLGEALGNHQTP